MFAFRQHWLCIAGLALLLAGCSGPELKAPVAKRGVLDLRGWDLLRNGPLSLAGQWEFHWKSLQSPAGLRKSRSAKVDYITVPAIWSADKPLPGSGYATYRLRILLGPQRDPLALKTRGMLTAFTLYVDGRKLLSQGRVGTSEKTHRAQRLHRMVEFVPRGNELELVLQVSNFHYRNGGTRTLELGLASSLREHRERGLAFELFILGALLIIGLYHLGLFALRREDLSPLFFALVCFIFAIRAGINGEEYLIYLAPELGYELFLMLEYLTVYLGLPLFCMFLHSVYPEEFDHRVLRVVQGLGAAFSSVVLLTPQTIYYHTFRPYHVIILLVGCYMLAVLFNAVRRKRDGAWILLFGFVVLFLAAVNDILNQNQLLSTGFISPVGLFVFVFSQAFLLSLRFSKTYAKIQQLSLALNNKSVELSSKNLRLLELGKLKDEFLANTSHELRTPLHGITGIAESLLDGAAGNLNPKQSDDLRLIQNSGRRLTKLVDDILDFAKLEHHDLELNLQPVHLYSLVDVVLALCRALVPAGADLALKNEVPRDFPAVLADEDRLQQILMNLVGNAVKFTPAGEVQVSATIAQDIVFIAVKDTGVGIAAEQQELIFESFRQADASVERQYGGTGLGLTITRRLVELHGGRIRLESEPGKGSVFTITMRQSLERSREEPDVMPSTLTAPEAPNSRPVLPSVERLELHEPGQDRATPEILAIDDDRVNLRVISNQLYLENYHVVTAQSGEDGLRLLSERSAPELVLLDVMMPKMSGFEVCREIRKTFGINDLPILFLTAKNRRQDVVTGFELGGNDYITKPFSRKELVSRIRFHVALTRSTRELKALKVNLEELVKERTAELKATLDELSRAHKELKRVSMLDGLTSTYNRQAFNEIFENEWKRAFREKVPLAMLLIDVDQFKPINDQHGHMAGDSCLQFAASAITRHARRPADIVARYGGDEFVVLLPHTSREGAMAVAEAIRAQLDGAEIPYEGLELRISVSIGVYCEVPTKRETRLQMLNNADEALYDAKARGRNCVSYHATVEVDSAPGTSCV